MYLPYMHPTRVFRVYGNPHFWRRRRRQADKIGEDVAASAVYIYDTLHAIRRIYVYASRLLAPRFSDTIYTK